MALFLFFPTIILYHALRRVYVGCDNFVDHWTKNEKDNGDNNNESVDVVDNYHNTNNTINNIHYYRSTTTIGENCETVIKWFLKIFFFFQQLTITEIQDEQHKSSVQQIQCPKTLQWFIISFSMHQ